MNRNTRNDQKDTDHNVYQLRKVSLWEKYGVKRFPYCGRRRYSPFAYRSMDGGIVISNDVFGLTIRQFERTYKACLNIRKTHEQYILNLRYPDKTSDEYMDYLQDSSDCNTDNVSKTGLDLKEGYLYKHLVNTAGTEIDIRKRQQLFITENMIHTSIYETIWNTYMYSGSLAEGIDLPGSDIDIVLVIENVDVIQNVSNIKLSKRKTTLVMEADNDHPGFTYLRLIAVGVEKAFVIPPELYECTKTGSLYLSGYKFRSYITNMDKNNKFSSHGPALTDDHQTMDLVHCLRSKYFPCNAWGSRYRLQWPPNSVIDQIKSCGCLLVTIGPRTLSDCNLLWKLSFSVAEKLLVHSFNYTQLLCYCLLKLTLKHIVNTNEHAKDLLCSYFLKTALFWVSEEVYIDTFQLSKLYFCFSKCLSKLILWVNKCYCPNYFIPEQNMFLGKISPDNNEILINVLDRIKRDGIDGLIQHLYYRDIGYHRLLYTQRASSFIMLDLLFYRLPHSYFVIHISQCWNTLKFIEYLLQLKSSAFIVDVLKYHHADISQYAAQSLPTFTVTTLSYKMQKRYHRHLQEGIKAYAVSGWLLYASFYYVTGQFDVTLKLTDYVLSRCSPNMVPIGCQKYQDRHINYYRNHVHSTMSIHEKMSMAVVHNVVYIHDSSLIPKELQLEVKNKNICIPPIVMSYCLRFLCYHHVGDIFNRHHALRDLYLTVKRKYLINKYTLSNSLTILGVCYEISGNKNAAYQCYVEALQCEGIICGTAQARRSKLEHIWFNR